MVPNRRILYISQGIDSFYEATKIISRGKLARSILKFVGTAKTALMLGKEYCSRKFALRRITSLPPTRFLREIAHKPPSRQDSGEDLLSEVVPESRDLFESVGGAREYWTGRRTAHSL